MSIINLIGPPAAGKSTFASKFVLEHPEYTYCSIDAYRAEFKDEVPAWEHLEESILKHPKVISETSGLSWRLIKIFNSRALRRRKIFTIAFTGSSNIILSRLQNRQRREVPYPYHYTETETVRYVLDNLNRSSTKINYTVNVDNKETEEIYLEISQILSEYLIDNIKSTKKMRPRLHLEEHNTDTRSEI